MLFACLCYSLVLLLASYAVEATEYFETFFIEPESSADNEPSRNALRLTAFKWPAAEVPFIFDESSYDLEDKQRVLDAMELITDETCVRFLAKNSSHIEHIKFIKSPDECGSNIGYRRYRADPLDVTYSPFCLRLRGAIQHELLHVLGLLHEQSRPDRDEYVHIVWTNIEPQFARNFMKADDLTAETFGLPYDFDSLMHYPSNAFARSSRNVTIYSRTDPGRPLGQSDGPTFFDLEKIRRMYC